jgi:hypothetical protein
VNSPLFRSSKRYLDFARFLLRNGFNPNMTLEVAIGPDYNNLMNNFHQDDSESEYKHDDIASEYRVLDAPETRIQLTIMHLALAMSCSSALDMRQVINLLEIISVLVEGGSNANVLNYRNHWSHREGEATERSAIHYLLSSSYDCAKPFHHPEFEVNHTLSRCITAFLNHGADPNAIDSNGVSILELALPICPYALVELMLEKGAQVTPKLLSESGAPLGYADGILNELIWRRPECYTRAARVIAGKHNTHWEDLEQENLEK